MDFGEFSSFGVAGLKERRRGNGEWGLKLVKCIKFKS
jgi:hypothetical protein